MAFSGRGMVLTFGILCEAPDCVKAKQKKGMAATIFAGLAQQHIGPILVFPFILF